MFYDNLKAACDAKGTKVTKYLESIGKSTALTGKWKHGGMPSVELLMQIATDLDVTLDYLLGRTSFRNTPSETPPDTITKQEKILLSAYRKLGDTAKRKVNEYIKDLSAINSVQKAQAEAMAEVNAFVDSNIKNLVGVKPKN